MGWVNQIQASVFGGGAPGGRGQARGWESLFGRDVHFQHLLSKEWILPETETEPYKTVPSI
eukprot:2649175-Rhodomonas_salina.1